MTQKLTVEDFLDAGPVKLVISPDGRFLTMRGSTRKIDESQVDDVLAAMRIIMGRKKTQLDFPGGAIL